MCECRLNGIALPDHLRRSISKMRALALLAPSSTQSTATGTTSTKGVGTTPSNVALPTAASTLKVPSNAPIRRPATRWYQKGPHVFIEIAEPGLKLPDGTDDYTCDILPQTFVFRFFSPFPFFRDFYIHFVCYLLLLVIIFIIFSKTLGQSIGLGWRISNSIWSYFLQSIPNKASAKCDPMAFILP